MTLLIAWRNLVQDKIRFLATLVGVVFSIVLIALQIGLLPGFMDTSTGLIRNGGADIWVMPIGTSNVDQVSDLKKRVLYQVRKLDGVAAASRYLIYYMEWFKPQGGTELVIVTGYDPETRLGAPWNVDEGSLAELETQNRIFIDRLYAAKLGVTDVGDRVEITRRKAIVAGFTSGIRTFTQSPYVFTSFRNAQRYTGLDNGDMSYVLVKASPGKSHEELAEEIRQAVPNVEVLLKEDFKKRTQYYWMFTTGAGSALIIGALLGALVGIVIVAQTLYAATMERISEYATLSAIGASATYLNSIVLLQAIISGVLGFVIAAVIALAVTWWSKTGPAAISLSPQTLFILAIAALLMCSAAALLAVRKVMTIDPTSVFR
jgi:putative ABC transport system permease protein